MKYVFKCVSLVLRFVYDSILAAQVILYSLACIGLLVPCV